MITAEATRGNKKKANYTVAATQEKIDKETAMMLLRGSAGGKGTTLDIKNIVLKKIRNNEAYFFVTVTDNSTGTAPLKTIRAIANSINSDFKKQNINARLRAIPSENKILCVPANVYKEALGN